jgi:hypothetical protein
MENPLTTYLAHKCYDILVKTVNADPSNRDCFVETQTSEVCHEYRLLSDLGFGGKFRRRDERSTKFSVDCYREDRTKERDSMIEEVNKLFETMT